MLTDSIIKNPQQLEKKDCTRVLPQPSLISYSKRLPNIKSSDKETNKLGPGPLLAIKRQLRLGERLL